MALGCAAGIAHIRQNRLREEGGSGEDLRCCRLRASRARDKIRLTLTLLGFCFLSLACANGTRDGPWLGLRRQALAACLATRMGARRSFIRGSGKGSGHRNKERVSRCR